MKVPFTYYLVLGVVLLCLGCSLDSEIPRELGTPYELTIPDGFPQMPIPADNQLTVERVELGRALFYDKRLSRDSTISCATCHIVSKGMADNNVLAVGINDLVGIRNVPTLGNIGYHPTLFREGGNPSLEAQVFGPIDSPEEMGFSVREAVDRLRLIPAYQSWAQETYDRDFDEFVLSRAIASFERILISGDAPYDEWSRGDETAMTESAKRGMVLFFDELDCGSCHTGFDFTNYLPANNGSHVTYDDPGLMNLTQNPQDRGKFKTLTLRNVEITGPYMHDGSYATLTDVIDNYSAGGSGHANQDPRIVPFAINAQEKVDLIEFLHSLTDPTFLSNPEYE